MPEPAWRLLPTWYLITTHDQAIPPEAQHLFANRMGATTMEVPSSHAAMVSHPDEVTRLIKTAAAKHTAAVV
jgi:pimeloyl-ACP methyl ester carboxylesterase